MKNPHAPGNSVIFLVLALLAGIILAACAPAATPLPVDTEAVVPTSAPAVTVSSSTESPTQPPGPTAVVVVPTSQPVSQPAAISENRLLTLDFPPRIRAGDSDNVRLTLEMDQNGNLTPTVAHAGNVVRGEAISLPNVFDHYNVLAEARMEMAGVDIRPPEMVSETLLPGQKVTFYWSVLPSEVGNYRGTVWFYLHYLPKDGGVESRQAVSAQEIEIEATSFFGLGANPARMAGLAGTFISGVLGVPFLEEIVKALWKRLRGERNAGAKHPLSAGK